MKWLNIFSNSSSTHAPLLTVFSRANYPQTKCKLNIVGITWRKRSTRGITVHFLLTIRRLWLTSVGIESRPSPECGERDNGGEKGENVADIDCKAGRKKKKSKLDEKKSKLDEEKSMLGKKSELDKKRKQRSNFTNPNAVGLRCWSCSLSKRCQRAETHEAPRPQFAFGSQKRRFVVCLRESRTLEREKMTRSTSLSNYTSSRCACKTMPGSEVRE